jgi:ribonuclease P protein component
MLLFLVLFSGPVQDTFGADDEAHFQPEQPAPQASPRLPCAHGHQGRSPRPRPSSRQGPQASCGLTVLTTSNDRTPVSRRFPRASRLTDKPQFDAVHRQGQRSSDALFLVLTRPNAAGHARLGLAVGIKAAGNAVKRNRIKRLARESFRHRQHELPALDVVVNARPAATTSSGAEIRASLQSHWDRIVRRCARS